jgi:hypothetical protein
MSDVNYNIEEELISIPSDTDGWNLELNKISWFGKEAKWDLRKWKDDRSKSQKGVTLSDDELVLFLQKAPEIIEKVTGEKLEFKTVD